MRKKSLSLSNSIRIFKFFIIILISILPIVVHHVIFNRAIEAEALCRMANMLALL